MTIDDDIGQEREAQSSKKRSRGWGLGTLPAVRRRLSRVLSDIDSGRIDLVKARTLIYGLSIAGGILKTEIDSGLEERIDRLYELMTKKEQTK